MIVEAEDYYFDVTEKTSDDRLFVLIIYDITNNKKRIKLAKFLSGFGFRIQKSAFEAIIPKKKYDELLRKLPAYVTSDDSIRVYRIHGKGQVTSLGKKCEEEDEDIIII